MIRQDCGLVCEVHIYFALDKEAIRKVSYKQSSYAHQSNEQEFWILPKFGKL